MAGKQETLASERRRKTTLSVVLAVICVIYVLPVVAVVINSSKLNTYVKTETFSLPTSESFAGRSNFINGMTFGNYPFVMSVLYSVFITVVSTFLILLLLGAIIPVCRRRIECCGVGLLPRRRMLLRWVWRRCCMGWLGR